MRIRITDSNLTRELQLLCLMPAKTTQQRSRTGHKAGGHRAGLCLTCRPAAGRHSSSAQSKQADTWHAFPSRRPGVTTSSAAAASSNCQQQQLLHED